MLGRLTLDFRADILGPVARSAIRVGGMLTQNFERNVVHEARGRVDELSDIFGCGWCCEDVRGAKSAESGEKR